MILGEVNSVEQIHDLEHTGIDWAEVCLGSFYVKPNYPGIVMPSVYFAGAAEVP